MMKLLYGAALGAMLLSAPVMALAAGGGRAGVAVPPPAEVFAGSSTNQSAFNVAGTLAGDLNLSGLAEGVTGTSQARPASNAAQFNPVTPVANQRGGGH